MSRPIPPIYKTKNWSAYNEALKQRGSLTIWFDPDMAWVPAPTGKRGRQPQYSDAAIQTCLSMKVLFGLALRQTTGFVESLLRLVDLGWPVPDFSTLSRRQKTLAVNMLLGQSLMARDFDRQIAELQIRAAVLNGYTALGIPVTEPMG